MSDPYDEQCRLNERLRREQQERDRYARQLEQVNRQRLRQQQEDESRR